MNTSVHTHVYIHLHIYSSHYTADAAFADMMKTAFTLGEQAPPPPSFTSKVGFNQKVLLLYNSFIVHLPFLYKYWFKFDKNTFKNNHFLKNIQNNFTIFLDDNDSR